MESVKLETDGKLTPFARKEKEIIAYTSLIEFHSYKIKVFEDEWENMNEMEKRIYIVEALNKERDCSPKEILEDYEEQS